MTGKTIPLRQVGTPSRAADLGRWPLLGRFLHWKHARTAVQIPMLLVAALTLFDGWIGPSLAPRNIAGVLPWVHWRGFVVLALLIAGNLFCMACPFMLPRRLAKRFFPSDRAWPAWIPGKWLAIALLLAFFWAYETFDLWASPWLTAWVAAAYFLTAFVVDGFFRGAAFCKHVCPIGQFNFVNSLVSPTEIRARDHDVCASCTTKDCIRGHHDSETGKLIQSGCELWLFQERKVGNMDCTYCLDCVQACPFDNVSMIARNPIREFGADVNRSGIGHLSRRTDIAMMALILVFGAFVNAFGMVSPVFRFQRWLAGVLGLDSDAAISLLIFGTGLVLIPVLLVAYAGLSSRWLAERRDLELLPIVNRFIIALVPLGMAMWTAHYGFHFFTGALTIVPVMQSFTQDIGIGILGEPRWDLAGILPVTMIDWFELLILELGLLGSLWAIYRTSSSIYSKSGAIRGAIPWAILAILLLSIGVWLMSQPMEMRGTVLG